MKKEENTGKTRTVKNILALTVPLSILFVSIIWLYIQNRVVDPDCYFILTNGRDILTDGIPYENTHFILSGLKTVVQQWLYSVMLYKLYQLCGMSGVKAVAYLGYMLMLLVTYAYMRKRGVEKKESFLLSVVSMIPMMYVFTSRPAVFTFVLLITQCIVVEDVKRKGKKSLLFLLPVLMLVEINIHASMWIMHMIFLLPYLMPDKGPLKIIDRHTRSDENQRWRKWLILPVIIMTGTLFVNPYGIKGITYLFDSYNRMLNNGYITELEPPQVKSVAGIFLVIICLAAGFAWNKKIIFRHTLYFVLGGILMAMMQYKNVPMLACAMMFLGADCLDNHRISLSSMENKVWCNRIATIICIFTGFLMVCTVSVGPEEKDYIMAPQAAVSYLKEHDVSKDSRLYTGFNTGAYLLWNGYHIYMEARPELYFKSINQKFDYYKEYSDVLYAKDIQTIEDFLSKYDFEYLIEDEGTPLDLYLQKSKDYTKVVDGDGYRMYQQLMGKEEIR